MLKEKSNFKYVVGLCSIVVFTLAFQNCGNFSSENSNPSPNQNAEAGTSTPAEDSKLEILAGNPYGRGSADGQGGAASFTLPYGVASDEAGNIYVADTYNSTIRKISPTGLVTTLAGKAGKTGSLDGSGSAASFNSPTGVATDRSGNVYVADRNNSSIRKITTAGLVTTIAGAPGFLGSTDAQGSEARFNSPNALAVDSLNNVFVVDTNNSTIRKITPEGVVSTFAGVAEQLGSADGAGSSARFKYPYGIAIDRLDHLYIADTYNFTIRKITPLGVVSTLAGSAGSAGFVDGLGTVARFNSPRGIVIDSSDQIYVSDFADHTIRKIGSDGAVTTFASQARNFGSKNGVGSAARFNSPIGLAADASGNIYVADNRNSTIRKITPEGLVSTFAGTPGVAGSADGSGLAASFLSPFGVGIDSRGSIYVADRSNNAIRRISPERVVSTLAGQPTQIGSVDGPISIATFNKPHGIAIDGSDNLYVADTYNSAIRKITPDGIVSTFAGNPLQVGSADGSGSAARFNTPRGIATDAIGNVIVADSENHTIRKISPDGIVSTLAGTAGVAGSMDGVGTSARFESPWGVATDSFGNVFVADSGNHTIRKISPNGTVSTLAGSAHVSGAIDGPGSIARFNSPLGIASDPSGNIYLSDTDNFTIRKINLAGDVSTVVGTPGVAGFRTSGAGIISYPLGVLIHKGTLFFSVNDSILKF